MENNTDLHATLIRALSSQRAGVAQTARDLRFRPAKLIGLLGGLEQEGLLELGTVHTGRAGRPKRLARATPLGLEYLRAYDLLKTKTLRSGRSDLTRAATDGKYAGRLVSRGVSPYGLFLELIELAGRS